MRQDNKLFEQFRTFLSAPGVRQRQINLQKALHKFVVRILEKEYGLVSVDKQNEQIGNDSRFV